MSVSIGQQMRMFVGVALAASLTGITQQIPRQVGKWGSYMPTCIATEIASSGVTPLFRDASDRLTSLSQPAFGPQEFRRKYGKANGNDYERWPRQNNQRNPDKSHGPANDSHNNTFGDTKIRNLQ